MLKFLDRLFSVPRLEAEVERLKARCNDLDLKHRTEIAELKADHIDHISDIERIYKEQLKLSEAKCAILQELQTGKEKLLERELERANHERKAMQDSFLRINGVEPIYQKPSAGDEVQYYENQPDDSGPIGARILSRSQKDQEEWQAQEEANFQRWQQEQLGITAMNGKSARKEGDDYE